MLQFTRLDPTTHPAFFAKPPAPHAAGEPSGEEARKVCSICLENLFKHQDLTHHRASETALHVFHQECLFTWATRKRACPLRCEGEISSINGFAVSARGSAAAARAAAQAATTSSALYADEALQDADETFRTADETFRTADEAFRTAAKATQAAAEATQAAFDAAQAAISDPFATANAHIAAYAAVNANRAGAQAASHAARAIAQADHCNIAPLLFYRRASFLAVQANQFAQNAETFANFSDQYAWDALAHALQLQLRAHKAIANATRATRITQTLVGLGLAATITARATGNPSAAACAASLTGLVGLTGLAACIATRAIANDLQKPANYAEAAIRPMATLGDQETLREDWEMILNGVHTRAAPPAAAAALALPE